MVDSFVNNYISAMKQGNSLMRFPAYSPKKTGVKPYSPKGYLVEENPLEATASSVNEVAKTGKYFINAINGKGNDYSVGKINDTTTKLGGLGIAALLSAGLSSRLGKGMEFVGFACFFGAMEIWPKLFVGLPLKLKTGINLSQEYVDSQGKRKRFYQDPQYICWDLMPDEKLQKIGDKLKVPKNIENRKEAIQDKIKQVIVQGNTITMLTAGIATPLLGSLMANYLRFPLSDFLEQHRIESAALKSKEPSYKRSAPGIVRRFITDPLAGASARVGYLILGHKTPKSSIKGVDFDKFLANISSLEKDYQGEDLKKIKRFKESIKSFMAEKGKYDLSHVAVLGDEELTTNAQNWGRVPMKLLDAMNMPVKTSKRIALSNDVNVSRKIFVNHLIKEFINPEGGLNTSKLEKTLKQVANLADEAVVDVDNAAQMLGKSLKKSQKLSMKAGFEFCDLPPGLQKQAFGISSAMANSVREAKSDISIKSANTKNSFYQFVNILDEIAKSNVQDYDETVSVFKQQGQVRKLADRLSGLLSLNAVDDIKNKADAQANLVDFPKTLRAMFKSDFSDLTKSILSNDQTDRIISHNNKMYDELVGEISDKNIKTVTKKLGMVAEELVHGITKQQRFYKTWLRRVVSVAAPVVGLTWLSISMLGQKNKFNPDVYEFKGGNR